MKKNSNEYFLVLLKKTEIRDLTKPSSSQSQLWSFKYQHQSQFLKTLMNSHTTYEFTHKQIYRSINWKSRSTNWKWRWRFQLTKDSEFEVVPSGVARFVARNIAPLADNSCSSSLKGSVLEQMSNMECQTLPRSI